MGTGENREMEWKYSEKGKDSILLEYRKSQFNLPLVSWSSNEDEVSTMCLKHYPHSLERKKEIKFLFKCKIEAAT